MIREVWRDMGIVGTVGELVDKLSAMPRDLCLSAAGGDCHILYNGLNQIVLDEKDYSDEWNEEV